VLILGNSYAPTWHGKPEGMTREDWPTWVMWLYNGDHQDESYYYNVRIGEGRPTPPRIPANYERAWILSGAFRIDALGISPGQIRLYEVKHIGSPTHVWQVNAYRTMLQVELGITAPLTAWLIAEKITPGTREQATPLDINVWTVQET
jgi:hypothetical protein